MQTVAPGLGINPSEEVIRLGPLALRFLIMRAHGLTPVAPPPAAWHGRRPCGCGPRNA